MTKSLGWCGLVLLALGLAAQAQTQERAESGVEQTLQSLGLTRMFASVQPLVQRTLAEAEGASAELKQVIAAALAAPSLQQALYTELAQAHEPEVYARAEAALADPAIAPAQAACAKLPDFGVEDELAAYQAKLATRSPRPLRTELARQMDQSARTSSIAVALYTRVERIVVEHTRADFGTRVPWSDVAVQRKLALQQSVVVWYLYCGRFAGDELLSQWIARHNEDPVQQALDDYQQALTLVLDRVSLVIAQQVTSLDHSH